MTTIRTVDENGKFIRAHDGEAGPDCEYCQICSECVTCNGEDECLGEGSHVVERTEWQERDLLHVLCGNWIWDNESGLVKNVFGSPVEIDNDPACKLMAMLPRILENLRRVTEYRTMGDNQRGEEILRDASEALGTAIELAREAGIIMRNRRKRP